MGMDSYEFPLKSYGDMGFRLYGQPMRYLFNILQSIQLILNVGSIIISNGLALSQAAKFKLCFAICCLVWAVRLSISSIRALTDIPPRLPVSCLVKSAHCRSSDGLQTPLFGSTLPA